MSHLEPVDPVGGSIYAVQMCRNIRQLHNFEPPATPAEVEAAATQFVRKVGGGAPSKANEQTYARAIAEVGDTVTRLLDELVTAAPPKNRDVEAAKARARSQTRFARPAEAV